jgi:hypothetical protein
LLGNIRTGRNFDLEKREQTHIIEGKKCVQDENRKVMREINEDISVGRNTDKQRKN